MLDAADFLTALYVSVDDFCQEHLPAGPGRRGPAASLSRSEAVTLSLFGQLCRFRSERDFWRYAQARLRPLFPCLPDRTQFNRLQREHEPATLAFSRHLARTLLEGGGPSGRAFEAVDRCGLATRWRSRRGAGWLPEYTDKGKCSRLGYFQGLHLLTCVSPEGVITGFCVGPASAKDQPLAEAFFCARHVETVTGAPDPRCPFVGPPAASGLYLADSGFIGRECHRRWRERFGAVVSCPDKRWQRGPRRWHAALRQIVEAVHDKLLNAFRLERERPHEIRGFFARLSAKVALHNFCIHLNRQAGRPMLQFADLIDW